MSDVKDEEKRVDDWLTGGRPRAFRTRGAVRTRGAAAPVAGPAIREIRHVTELLARLKEDVPEAPWVIVVDGNIDAFAESACLQAKKVRESSKFWLVGSQGEISEGDALAALKPLRLNPQDAGDLRFLQNLVADLVIIPKEPEASQGERVRRWLRQARYIVAEQLDESVIEELRKLELADGSKAEIFVIKGEE